MPRETVRDLRRVWVASSICSRSLSVSLVELPQGHGGTAEALFSAELRHPRLGVRKHWAELPPMAITLPG